MAGIPPQLAAAIAAKQGKGGPPLPFGKKKPPAKKTSGGNAKGIAQRIMQKKAMSDDDADDA